MKKLTIGFCAVAALVSGAFAGTSTYSGKETKNAVTQTNNCTEFYANNEFDVSVFGTYAVTGTNYRDDRYLAVDHAWGGGLDAKYFFARYFGFGVEAYGLHTNSDRNLLFVIPGGFRRDTENGRDWAGAALGTFTFRFPITCSRFAPYAFAGGGGIWNGRDRTETFIDTAGNIAAVRTRSDNGKWLGQFGGGFEIRFTPHVGLTNDFSWNVVDGPKNNYGMVRTGINFAF